MNVRLRAPPAVGAERSRSRARSSSRRSRAGAASRPTWRRPAGARPSRRLQPRRPPRPTTTPRRRAGGDLTRIESRHDRHARPSTASTRCASSRSTWCSRPTAAIPGLPLGAAPMAYVLWTRFLKHDPAHPLWPDRDRFVLSAGHGSALLYSLLHMTGYDALARRHRALPPVGQQGAGPSRARPHRRRRDHDRAARPGPRQRRRHGDRRGAPGGALQPRRPRASSTTAPGRSSATAT